MNTPNNTPPYPSDRQDNDEFDLIGLLYVVLDARWLILASTLIALLIGATYAFLSKPVYQVDTLIQVEQSQGSNNNVLGQIATLFDVQSPATAEIEILRSRLVVGQAADSLQLYTSASPNYLPLVGGWLAQRATELSNPGFMGFGGYVWGKESIRLEQLDVPKALEGVSLALVATATGYDLLDPKGKKLTSGKVGELSEFQTVGGSGRILVASLQAKPGAQFNVIRQSRFDLVTNLRNSLVISEKGRQSGVLSIVLEGTNPARITRILNAVGTAYVRQNTQRKAAEAEKSLTFLEAFLPQLKSQMDQSEATYTKFRDQHGTFDLTTEGALSLNSSVALQTQLLALEQRRRELASQFASSHPAVQVIDKQINAMNSEIGGLNDRIKTLPDLQQRLLNLQRDVQVNGELYVNLLNSAQQLRLVKEGKVGNVRVVDTALSPERPIKPNRSLVLVIAGVLGLIIGIAIALLRNMLRKGIQDPADIENNLGLHVFATVPHSARQSKLHQLASNHVPGIHVLAETAPQDPAIESLRSLRTTLQFAMLDAANNIVLLTGATPNVGKSFASVNFAALLGSADKRALLVDADLRRGYLHQYFGLKRRNGLSELIGGSLPMEQAIHKDVLRNVDLLTTGVLPPNPAEVLLSVSAVQLLKNLSAQYDLVILDGAPVLAVSDAIALAPHAGTVFLLARAQVSTLAELEEATKRLYQAGAQIKGVIFNDLMASGRRYGAKYRNYDYGDYAPAPGNS